MKLTKTWFKKWEPCTSGVKWFLKNFKYGDESTEVIKALIKEDKLDDAARKEMQLKILKYGLRLIKEE